MRKRCDFKSIHISVNMASRARMTRGRNLDSEVWKSSRRMMERKGDSFHWFLFIWPFIHPSVSLSPPVSVCLAAHIHTHAHRQTDTHTHTHTHTHIQCPQTALACMHTWPTACWVHDQHTIENCVWRCTHLPRTQFCQELFVRVWNQLVPAGVTSCQSSSGWPGLFTAATHTSDVSVSHSPPLLAFMELSQQDLSGVHSQITTLFLPYPTIHIHKKFKQFSLEWHISAQSAVWIHFLNVNTQCLCSAVGSAA